MRRAGGERIGGVGQQVHHHLPNLRRVGFDGRQVLREAELDLDVARNHRLEQLGHLGDQRRDIDALEHEAAASRVGELAGELGGPGRRALDLMDLLAHGRTAGQVHLREPGLPEDADEQVVEVVHNAAGEKAEALEPLRVLHAAIERPPLVFGARTLGNLTLQRLRAFVDDDGEAALAQTQLAHSRVR